MGLFYFLLLVLSPAGLFAAPSLEQVLGVLNASCGSCHATGRTMGGLRLDAAEGLAQGGASGAVVIAGKSAESLLIKRLVTTDAKQRMPLGGAPMKTEQIAMLREWIDAGAVLPKEAYTAKRPASKHWAYNKPVRHPLPEVKNPAGVRNAIDRFILARLEKQGLSLSPEASKETLIRRLSLDLVGLPPSIEEVDAFLNDTRADAYERAVERLLASPHYGERWAGPWLDLARYADTNGYEADRSRKMHKFRDWVIDAFNKDMPFDQFTREQIAGDLLPNATATQKIATGFHRNTMYNEEGGVDKEEAHFEVLADRVTTTATVWLGSTLTCAQCHNHKSDPFPQKDFYQLMAFFSHDAKDHTTPRFREPQLDLATPEQEGKRKAFADQIKSLETQLKTATADLEREQQQWEESVRNALTQWQTLKPERVSAKNGATLKADETGAILASGANPQLETYVVEGPLTSGKLSGLRIEALPHQSLPREGPGRDAYGNFIFTEVRIELQDAAGQWRRVEPERSYVDDGRMGDKRNRQLWTVDASRDEKRFARQMVFEIKPAAEAKRARITIVQNSDFVGQAIGHFRLSTTTAADPALVTKVRAKLRPVLDIKGAQRSEAQQKELAEFFRAQAPSLASAREELRKLRAQMDALGIETALVLAEGAKGEEPCDFVRIRGVFSAKADKVCADVPSVMHPLPEGAPRNRLGLAAWLASRDNPLTARVMVNRIWAAYFGRGIVETSEDFGSLGTKPTHPELLDWLAVEWMDRGWSMKAMHRLIVNSAAYRQTSSVSAAVLEADPDNRLISRGPRFRMEGEMIRDAALTASGLLSRKIGGPSVFPPQPPGVWDLPYNDEQWIESKGDDRYRRGLYTFVRRSAMYPAMVNFDATSREICTVRRIRTNTPLQALTVLNDEAFFETAKALARRMVEKASTDTARLEHGFRLVTARRPRNDEATRMLAWLARERTYFQDHSQDAARLGGPETAAWTMLANVLLNLDEALTKE
jgi:hypothetical protein